MLEQFTQFINQQALFRQDQKVLLAVSGGIDSVAMLSCFKEAGVFNFAVAHCNFSLRGEESDADEAFVKKLAKKAKVPFFSHSFDTKAFAEQEKISIQMAARQLRYAWFGKLMDNHGFHYLATAHHQNDLVETVLFNLTKGTGIAGLHGIKCKAGRIIRPLLFADKSQIYDYVAEKRLVWREDASNESRKYARNLIRKEVVPVLKTINPDLEDSIRSSSERVSQVEEIFYAHVNDIREKSFQKKENDLFIDLNVLKACNINAVVLYELVREFGFEYAQVKIIYEKIFEGPGKVFLTPAFQLNVDRKFLIVTPRDLDGFVPDSITEIQPEFNSKWLKMRFSMLDGAGFQISSSDLTAALDCEKLKFPLEIRKWKQGDYFFPLGMKHKKKLSDFMIDQKIPLNLKERVFLLTSNQEVVWVIGYRIDDRYKITKNTRRIFMAEIVRND